MALEIVHPDSPFVAAIIDGGTAIREYRAKLRGHPVRAAATDCAHLAEICNVAFWASLHQEERRSIRVNLAIGAAEEFTNPLLFNTPEPFEVGSLVNLASAAEGSVLGIYLGADDRWEIWGIAKRPPKLALSISVIKPGTVGVFYYQELLPVVAGLIDNGELVIPSGASLETFQQLVADAFKGNAPDLGSRFRRAGQLIEIVHAMCAHTHGGTLVIVPDDATWHDDVTMRYPCGTGDGSHFLKTSSERSFVSDRDATRAEDQAAAHSPLPDTTHHLTQKAKKDRSLTRQALRRVGQLTAVDGAVIIGNNFIVYGFGARLKAADTTSEIIAVDALTGENTVIALTKLGGTRHQSAARFVHANMQSIAIVSSQDGGLTLVGRTKNESALIAIQNLQHLLIHWEGPIER